MLRDGQVSADRLQLALTSVDRNAEPLNAMLNDLLDLSRVGTGRLHLSRHPLNLGEVVREATSQLGLAAAAKHIIYRLGLPSTTVIIDGDPTRLRQVIWNLLSNALKFTPQGVRSACGLTPSGVAQSCQSTIVDRVSPHHSCRASSIRSCRRRRPARVWV